MTNIEYSYKSVILKRNDIEFIDKTRKESQLSFLYRESFVSLASDYSDNSPKKSFRNASKTSFESDNSPKKSFSKASKTSFEDSTLGNRLIENFIIIGPDYSSFDPE